MESAVTVLPQPLSPTRQTVSPAPIVSDTPSTARRASVPAPKSIFRFLISSRFISLDRIYGMNKIAGRVGALRGVPTKLNSEKFCLHNDFVSAASLNPSPRKLKARTVTKIAAPGASSHG